MQALFEEIRENCSSNIWSRGVELNRAGAVITEASEDDEITLKVATRQGMAYATVTLWPEDEDWSCDCKSAEPACAHVAAAAIALRQAKSQGQTAPQPKLAPGKVGYRLKRQDRALVLERVVLHQDATQPLTHSLEALSSGRVDGPAVMIAQSDLAVEHVLGRRHNGVIPREMMPKLLGALAQCHDVHLDNEPIQTSSKAVLPQACVEDRGDGFALFIERDPSIREVFKNGVVLCDNTLRPVGQSGLTAREREELQGPDGRYFAPDGVAELATEILPSLRKRVPVDIRTSRLPSTQVEPPHLRITTRREHETLVVEPQLLYGEPPTARIEDDRLIPLGQGALPIRDVKTEQRLARQLQQLKLVPGKPLNLTGANAVDLAERLKTWPGRIDGNGHAAFFLAPALRPQVQLDADHFNVFFESEADGGGVSRGGRASTRAVLRAWQNGESLVPLQGGGWAPLPMDWLHQFGPQVADLLAAKDAANGLPPSALPDLARLCDALDEPRPPELARLQTLLDDFSGIPDAELTDDLRAVLRPYQRDGVNWLVFLRQAGLGAMLADDMGLGKTLQALCAVQGRTLVVAPTSVMHNWAEEIQRFRPSLRCSIYHGPQRQLDPQADVTVTTYAILRLDIATLASQPWDTAVLDEAQYIKNPESQVAQAAYQLQSDFRLTLSGTPIENRLDELWSQFHFLNHGLLGGRQHFQERYVKAIGQGQPGAAEQLRERLRPFILRRRKRDVATELPPRTEVVLRCVLTEDEHQVYQAIQAATRSDVVKRLAAGGSVLEALEALLRLRQAACHSGLVPGHDALTSSKVDLLVETLDQVIADGHKALVFSQWTALLDRVEPHLRNADMDFVRLDGATRDRAGVVQRFQADDGPPIMLISLRAGGVGLNLTAADHIFLLDPWWNPAVEDQAADRAHRIGQERPVLVTRLVAQGTVEERILALQQQKRLLAETVLDGADQASALTREDLMALLV